MIEPLLKRIEAPEFLRGRIWWGGDAMSPYSHDELVAFVNMDAKEAADLKAKFAAFKEAHSSLSDGERAMLRKWAHAEFVEPTWRNGKSFPRPDFANANFFQNGPRSGKLLDVAPAHGCHGALLYRDHFRYAYELHTCDFSPAYNKLLTLLGVNVQHVDLRFDRLIELGQVFDVVTLTEVLEHVDQAVENRVLADMHAITRSGSRVFVTFPVKALPAGAPDANDPLGHVRQPNADAVARGLYGFKVLEQGKFSSGKYDQVYMKLERA